MLRRDAEVAKEFIASIIRAERTWAYFSDPNAADARAPPPRAATARVARRAPPDRATRAEGRAA
jgi:hypothetical protein